MNYAITASKTQAQLHKFLGMFSPHFSKPKLRFLGQMPCGIQAAQDVKPGRIERTLDQPAGSAQMCFDFDGERRTQENPGKVHIPVASNENDTETFLRLRHKG